MSEYIDITLEEINNMNKDEIYHLVNFIIKCGNIKNVFWGSLKNGTNIRKIKNYIEKLS